MHKKPGMAMYGCIMKEYHHRSIGVFSVSTIAYPETDVQLNRSQDLHDEPRTCMMSWGFNTLSNFKNDKLVDS